MKIQMADRLLVSYMDDENITQGPYDASAVLNWFKKGFFDDYHLLTIIDNGMVAENRVTYEATVQELKAIFGHDSPIPTTLRQLYDKRIPKTLLKSPAEKARIARNALKRAKMRRKEMEKEASEDVEKGEVLKQMAVVPDARESTEPCSPNKGVDSTEKPGTSHNTAPVRLVLPPALQTTREVLKGGSAASCEQLPSGFPSLHQSDVVGKVRFASSSTSGRPDKGSGERTRPKHKPFFDGSTNKKHQALPQVVVLEFVSYLHRKVLELNSRSRAKFYSTSLSRFGIPQKCEMCGNSLTAPANYFSHIFSKKHIYTSMSEHKRVFTMEEDYDVIKSIINEATSEKGPALPAPNGLRAP